MNKTIYVGDAVLWQQFTAWCKRRNMSVSAGIAYAMRTMLAAERLE